MPPSNSKLKKVVWLLVSFLVIIALVFGAYYLFRSNALSRATPSLQAPQGFEPFGTIAPPVSSSSPSNSTTPGGAGNGSFNPSSNTPTATLRMLSGGVIGGYGVNTIGSTTVIRWVDRGRGNVYETKSNDLAITTLSNTVVPMIYQSAWNKALTAFVGSTLPDSRNNATTIYAELKPSSAAKPTDSTNTSAELTPYTLKGKNLPSGTIGFATSPKRDRLFTFVNESGRGVGYVSNFDGTNMKRLFDTPLLQMNVEWPEDNTITLTTKGSAGSGGFLYFVNASTGVWKKIMGPIAGLSTRTSHDAKHVIFSATASNMSLATGIFTVAKKTSADAVVRTLADKCAWGNFYKSMVYCAAPNKVESAAYPDDWYLGTISFSDKIWQINSDTADVHLVSNIVDTSDRVIDAMNLSLDPRDDFLYFINKNDLSFWSLDLVGSF